MKILKGEVMIKVIYNGSSLLLKNTSENCILIEQLRFESEQKHLRFEVRFGRVRTIYYYDYDKSKEHGDNKETSDV